MTPLTIDSPTQGDIEHNGDVIILSEYRGTIHCESTVYIKANATAQGEVHTQNAHIMGSFNGFLEVRERVIFTGGSHFERILDAANMVCSLGTTIIGEIRVTPNKI